MTSEYSPGDPAADLVLSILGDDPFAHVYQAVEGHRRAHGEACDAFPISPLTARLLAVLVRAAGARRILELGCGLGYSALHLAAAAGPRSRVETVERDPEHIRLAREVFRQSGMARRLHILEGDAAAVLRGLAGPYDLLFDDVWFIDEPLHLPDAVRLLRPAGLLVMSNWFPLEDAATGGGTDWAPRYGADWRERLESFARRLAAHPRLRLAFSLKPWLALAVKVR